MKTESNKELFVKISMKNVNYIAVIVPESVRIIYFRVGVLSLEFSYFSFWLNGAKYGKKFRYLV